MVVGLERGERGAGPADERLLHRDEPARSVDACCRIRSATASVTCDACSRTAVSPWARLRLGAVMGCSQHCRGAERYGALRTTSAAWRLDSERTRGTAAPRPARHVQASDARGRWPHPVSRPAPAGGRRPGPAPARAAPGPPAAPRPAPASTAVVAEHLPHVLRVGQREEPALVGDQRDGALPGRLVRRGHHLDQGAAPGRHHDPGVAGRAGRTAGRRRPARRRRPPAARSRRGRRSRRPAPAGRRPRRTPAGCAAARRRPAAAAR